MTKTQDATALSRQRTQAWTALTSVSAERARLNLEREALPEGAPLPSDLEAKIAANRARFPDALEGVAAVRRAATALDQKYPEPSAARQASDPKRKVVFDAWYFAQVPVAELTSERNLLLAEGKPVPAALEATLSAASKKAKAATAQLSSFLEEKRQAYRDEIRSASAARIEGSAGLRCIE